MRLNQDVPSEDKEKIIVKLHLLGYRLTKNKNSMYKTYTYENKKYCVFFKLENLNNPYAKPLAGDGFVNIKSLRDKCDAFNEDSEELINNYDEVMEK